MPVTLTDGQVEMIRACCSRLRRSGLRSVRNSMDGMSLDHHTIKLLVLLSGRDIPHMGITADKRDMEILADFDERIDRIIEMNEKKQSAPANSQKS